MIKHIPASERHFSDFKWLKTYWLFSFSNYYDPNNMQFGTMRVFNDDVIAPHSGFPDHPHDNMEIVTIVLSGTIIHTDSMDNQGTVTAGEVQRMSAGNGIVHSEMNKHDEPVHLYQLWFMPDEDLHNKLESGYEQKKIVTKGKLVPLVSNTQKGALGIGADVEISQLNLKKTESLTVEPRVDYGIFLYLTEGELEVNGTVLNAGDQARITREQIVTLQAAKNSSGMIIQVLV